MAEDVSGSDRGAWLAGGARHLERQLSLSGVKDWLPDAVQPSGPAGSLNAASHLFLSVY